MGAVVDYAKARPVFDGYKAARYSKKYQAEHEAELATYRAARAAMNELLGGEKLPKMDELKKQRRELADKKKALYAEYRQAQQKFRVWPHPNCLPFVRSSQNSAKRLDRFGYLCYTVYK